MVNQWAGGAGNGWRRGGVSLLFVLLFWGEGSCLPPPAKEVAAAAPEISAEMRCAVCGKQPADNPRWQYQLIMGDGRQVAFDSGRELFNYLKMLEKFGYAEKQGLGKGLARIWVRDFSTGAWVDGHEAWYVVGSDERGPRGREIIPFAGQTGAEAFRSTHGGQLLKFAQIDSAVLKSLGE